MPTKPIERLMFAQGGNFFFCRQPLPRADASVENCVACCKSLKRLFGHVSLKEKLNIILNQRGDVRCPAAADAVQPLQAIQIKSTETAQARERQACDRGEAVEYHS